MLVVDRAVYQRLEAHLAQLYGPEKLSQIMNRIELLVGRYGVGTCPDEHRDRTLWDERDVVLITYGDMVRAEGEPPLRSLLHFVENRLGEAVSAVHVLPFFPYSSDDGFSVIDYRQVDPGLGDWEDIRALSAGDRYRLMVDLVINHVSSKSNWFRSFANGIAPERHYFIEVDLGTDLSSVTRPRTSPLLRPVQTPSGERLVWATFSHDQVDLDFRNPDVLFEFLDILLFYVHHGARIVRLDAIAYLWKEIGTSCVHLEQTHLVVKVMRDLLDLLAPGIILLTEANVPHEENVSYFGAGEEAHMVYQFSLPPLLLHALETGKSSYLTDWIAGLQAPPPGCTFVNFTASHDGIGVRPLEGLLPDEELCALVARVEQKGGHVSRRENPDGSQTPYELNITFFDALGDPGRCDSDLGISRFLCSQTIMLSLQGIPGIYFNSLIGASNWLAGVQETGRARTINRQKWGLAELDDLLGNPTQPATRVLAAYRRLLGIRREHAAFHPDGPQRAIELPPGLFGIERTAPGGSERIWALANLTAEPLEVDAARLGRGFGQQQLSELIQGWTAPGAELGRLQLAPYQVLWLQGGAATESRDDAAA